MQILIDIIFFLWLLILTGIANNNFRMHKVSKELFDIIAEKMGIKEK